MKLLTELGPLILFFIGYKTGGIMYATAYMLVGCILALLITYIKDRTIHKMTLISSLLLLFSGSLTLFSGNAIFIKMKPTILYCIFASIFFFTNMRKKTAIEFVLGAKIQLREKRHWQTLNLRFMLFFITMAILNEMIWRNFTEETWVNFKIFGMMPIIFIFTMLQLPFIMKYRVPEKG